MSDALKTADITVTITDLVPTVPYGNATVTATCKRTIVDGGDSDEGRQHRIDQMRLLAKEVEYVVGAERRLLQWAIDPSLRIQSPVTGEDAFAAPPASYDATKVVDPRDQPPVQVG